MRVFGEDFGLLFLLRAAFFQSKNSKTRLKDGTSLLYSLKKLKTRRPQVASEVTILSVDVGHFYSSSLHIKKSFDVFCGVIWIKEEFIDNLFYLYWIVDNLNLVLRFCLVYVWFICIHSFICCSFLKSLKDKLHVRNNYLKFIVIFFSFKKFNRLHFASSSESNWFHFQSYLEFSCLLLSLFICEFCLFFLFSKIPSKNWSWWRMQKRYA